MACMMSLSGRGSGPCVVARWHHAAGRVERLLMRAEKAAADKVNDAGQKDESGQRGESVVD